MPRKGKFRFLRIGRLFRRRRNHICEESFRKAIMERAERVLAKELSFLDNTITIDYLARAVGTNRTYLSQSVRIERGLTFCEYINNFRIEYAKVYMQGGQMKRDTRVVKEGEIISTEELAIISGFGSKRNFVRQFRRMEGVTPVQYYKRLRSGMAMSE